MNKKRRRGRGSGVDRCRRGGHQARARGERCRWPTLVLQPIAHRRLLVATHEQRTSRVRRLSHTKAESDISARIRPEDRLFRVSRASSSRRHRRRHVGSPRQPVTPDPNHALADVNAAPVQAALRPHPGEIRDGAQLREELMLVQVDVVRHGLRQRRRLCRRSGRSGRPGHRGPSRIPRPGSAVLLLGHQPEAAVQAPHLSQAEEFARPGDPSSLRSGTATRTIETVGSQIPTQQVWCRVLGARMVALEDQLMARKPNGLDEAAVQQAQDYGMEPAADGR